VHPSGHFRPAAQKWYRTEQQQGPFTGRVSLWEADTGARVFITAFDLATIPYILQIVNPSGKVEEMGVSEGVIFVLRGEKSPKKLQNRFTITSVTLIFPSLDGFSHILPKSDSKFPISCV